MPYLYTGVDQDVPYMSPPADVVPGPTTVRRDPCPKCRSRDYICVNKTFRCNTCKLTQASAVLETSTYAQVNENGHLLCQKCNVANEYATADTSGGYTCTGCKMMAAQSD